jgi:hypothetical protein
MGFEQERQAKSVYLPGELVIEHVGEPLEENQRQNEVPYTSAHPKPRESRTPHPKAMFPERRMNSPSWR